MTCRLPLALNGRPLSQNHRQCSSTFPPRPLPSVLHAVWLDHVLVTCHVLIVEYLVATSLSLLHLPSPPPLMTRSKAKAGVSRQVKFSQLGPQGQLQTTILNQSALTRRREAAAKVRLDILQGMLYSTLLRVDMVLNRLSDILRAWRRKQAPA